MKKVGTILLLLTLTAGTSLAAGYTTTAVVYDHTYHTPIPLSFNTETVTLKVEASVDNSPIATTSVSGVLRVYSTTGDPTRFKITKNEAPGGYAHGVSYWIDNGARHDILYSDAGDGSVTLSIGAGRLLQVELYHVVVFTYEAIGPQVSFGPLVDTAGPALAPSPPPGASGSIIVAANATDSGSGLAATNPVHWTLTKQGGDTTSDNGSSVGLTSEGIYTLRFDATDRLGNTRSWQGVYTVDYGPPTLSAVVMSANPRTDGSLDLSVHFDLTDPGAGLNLGTLQVQLSLPGQSWSLALATLSTTPNGNGGVTVSVPTVTGPRASQVVLQISVADNLQKTLTSNDADLTFPLFSASIPASGLTGTMQPPAQLPRVPFYSVPIVFDLAATAFNSIRVSRYTLKRTVGAGGITEVAADFAASAFPSRLSGSGGFAVYTDSMTGAAYAHKTVSYTLETTFTAGGIEESDLGTATLPDILAWSVMLNVGGQTRQSYLSGGGPAATDLGSFAGAMFVLPPDPEGDPLTMQIQFLGPDGVTGTYPAAGGVTQALLSDVFANGPEGIYDCTVLVSEVGSSTVQTSSPIRITMGENVGQITENTTWTVAKALLAPVTVHSGATLRVSADVTISDPRISITVLPGASLVIDDGIVIQPNGWAPGENPGVDWQYWDGINASGGADGSGTLHVGKATIRGALMGVAALKGSVVAIQGTRFEGCRTGVHAYGSAPTIDGAWFVGSARYGIKEDAGGNPVVTNSRFQGNTYDYYDEYLTVVDAEGINGLPPLKNAGNASVPIIP